MILENFRQTKVLILLGNLARSLKFGAFEIISRKSLLFLPRWNMIHVNFFCCLARDCNYRDENLHDVNFKSGLYCTRKTLFSKLLDVSEVFETFMYAITSHKKQRAKYQREVLSHIEKTAILVKRSNNKASCQRKKTPSDYRHR